MADDETRQDASEPGYWRSLRELYDGDSVREQKAQEFMAGVTDAFDPGRMPAMSRKQFLALLSASAAFAAAGCTNYRDKGEIVPYTKKPEEIVPGVANLYASTCTGCAQQCGILVKTREGRPIKIDGNPDHPVNRGKICATGQASILHLYDPARLRRPMFGPRSGRIGDTSWDEADAAITGQLSRCVEASREIALVTHGVASPSARALVSDFQRTYPTARVYAYDLFHEGPRDRAWIRCYGDGPRPAVAWDRADVILALESDFLGTEGWTIEQIRRYAGRRDVMGSTSFNRLYCVEGGVSLTGTNADYRLRLRPDAQLEFILCLIHELEARSAVEADATLTAALRGRSLNEFAAHHGMDVRTLEHLADDLASARGRTLVHAGAALPEDVHVAVNYLNELLGAADLFDWQAARPPLPVSSKDDWKGLIARMKDGSVGIVVHLDANPVYHLPSMLGYADALGSVPMVVSLVEAEDETSQHCTYILPINHQLESWGDYAPQPGVHSFQQPVIAPLYDTRQKEAVVLQWMAPGEPYAESIYVNYLKRRWESAHAQSGSAAAFARFWPGVLHDGVLVQQAPAIVPRPFLKEAVAILAALPPEKGFTVSLRASHFIGDGRFANNGWLQELPDPVTKIVWDNYAAVSPASAAALGVTSGDHVEIALSHGKARIPVFVQPGQADNHLSISLGYGRTNAGPIGSGVGVAVGTLLSGATLEGVLHLAGAAVSKADGRTELVSTQEHHGLDDSLVAGAHEKRKIIREGTLRQYRDDPGFLHHEKHELTSISTEVTYAGLKWAMSVDLNKCVGCNACVAACDVENNIPVVGKDQVAAGREMQWIRIDRYYAGSVEAPRLSHQPMLCQHCDNAPCENVCPVVATTHSPDGLNQMTYNRCVGTKYCSNNCPYKVRRFNFFDWRDRLADGYYEQEPIALLHNPEVTVRSRGVMEKCTFCVQRIMEARQHAAEEGRALRGSDVTTACQQACPAQAIVFGDMNDPGSDVSRHRSHELGYHVLDWVNARPNVTYIARLRNTHPEGTS
jgi:molybdopterin-containing oxidoreductase family iron-sulfur binding subunit